VISAIVDKAKGELNPLDLNRVLDAVVGDITKDPALSGNDLVSLATHYHAFSGSNLQSWTLPTAGVHTSGYGDVEVVQPSQSQQVVEQFLGGPASLPITTPPLDGYGEPQASASTSVTSTTSALSSPSGTAGSTTTTVPQVTPTQFDPRVC